MIGAVFLLLLGFGLVIAEVFFPSMGILSLLAGGSILGATVLAFQESNAAGWSVLLTGIIGLPFIVFAAFRLFPRTPVGRRMVMAGSDWKPEERAAVEHSAARYVGQSGRAESSLRPAGIAMFGDDRVDVVTRGEHLERGTAVHAVRFVGNRLVVEAATENPDNQS